MKVTKDCVFFISYCTTESRANGNNVIISVRVILSYTTRTRH